MALFGRPSATSSSTSVSRGVSGSIGAAHRLVGHADRPGRRRDQPSVGGEPGGARRGDRRGFTHDLDRRAADGLTQTPALFRRAHEHDAHRY